MWSRYTWQAVAGLSCVGLTITGVDIYYTVHPPVTFQSSTSDLTFSLSTLSQRLKTQSSAPPPTDLFLEPTSRFYLTPILPMEQIKQYLTESQADLLFIDFGTVQLKGEDLFQRVYSLVKSPPPLASCRDDHGFHRCQLLFFDILPRLRTRATVHLVTTETEMYETQALLRDIYQLWYGKDAYSRRFGKPKYPVVVLVNTESWTKAGQEEMAALQDFYFGLSKLVGSAHIFIESSEQVERLIAVMDRQMLKSQSTKEVPEDV